MNGNNRLLVLVAAAGVGLSACGGSPSPQVASLATPSSTTNASATLAPNGSGNTSGSPTNASPSNGNPTALLDEWATCMRSHGDPSQTDPTIDAYGVISINIISASPALSNAVHSGTDPCDRYVAAAQSALRAAHPVAPPPDQAQELKYVSCMRANGIPKYPYPTGNKTNFNGTGVDPNSPLFQNVNRLCGKKLGFPAWLIDGTGPPGDVTVSSEPPGAPPPGSGGGPRPATIGNGASGGNGGTGAGG
jgi:hypothetical protein